MVTNVFNGNLKRIRNETFSNTSSINVLPGKYLNHDVYKSGTSYDCILFTYKFHAILCAGVSTSLAGFAFGMADYHLRQSTGVLSYIGSRNITQSGLISAVSCSTIYDDSPKFTFNLSSSQSGLITIFFESFESNYVM